MGKLRPDDHRRDENHRNARDLAIQVAYLPGMRCIGANFAMNQAPATRLHAQFMARRDEFYVDI